MCVFSFFLWQKWASTLAVCCVTLLNCDSKHHFIRLSCIVSICQNAGDVMYLPATHMNKARKFKYIIGTQKCHVIVLFACLPLILFIFYCIFLLFFIIYTVYKTLLGHQIAGIDFYSTILFPKPSPPSYFSPTYVYSGLIPTYR